MEPPTPADNPVSKDCTAGKHVCNCKLCDVDISSIVDLAADIRQRLSVDVYGNFEIAGAPLGRDGRHTQLREVVQLTNKIDLLVTDVLNRTDVATTETTKEAKKNAKAAASQTAALRSMAEQQHNVRVQDLKEENERLKGRVTQAELQINKNTRELVALKESLRMAESDIKKDVEKSTKKQLDSKLKGVWDDLRQKVAAREVDQKLRQEKYDRWDDCSTVRAHTNTEISKLRQELQQASAVSDQNHTGTSREITLIKRWRDWTLLPELR